MLVAAVLDAPRVGGGRLGGHRLARRRVAAHRQRRALRLPLRLDHLRARASAHGGRAVGLRVAAVLSAPAVGGTGAGDGGAPLRVHPRLDRLAFKQARVDRLGVVAIHGLPVGIGAVLLRRRLASERSGGVARIARGCGVADLARVLVRAPHGVSRSVGALLVRNHPGRTAGEEGGAHVRRQQQRVDLVCSPRAQRRRHPRDAPRREEAQHYEAQLTTLPNWGRARELGFFSADISVPHADRRSTTLRCAPPRENLREFVLL